MHLRTYTQTVWYHPLHNLSQPTCTLSGCGPVDEDQEPEKISKGLILATENDLQYNQKESRVDLNGFLIVIQSFAGCNDWILIMIQNFPTLPPVLPNICCSIHTHGAYFAKNAAIPFTHVQFAKN